MYKNSMYKSFSINDQIFFAQRLSLLLDSNISLTESLNIMKSMETSKARKKVYGIFINDCEHGIPLSKSIINSSVKFDLLLITLIKNGEYSGSLVSSLLQVSKNLEKRNDFKKRLISTLIYPAFIFVVTICMALFLVMYIFPKILPMLSSMNIKLPLLTLLVKSAYEYTFLFGLQTMGAFVVSVLCFAYLLKKSDWVKRKIHSILLATPLLGKYLKLKILSSLCGIGEMLLSSGRSLSEFHLFARDSLSNVVIKNSFQKIHAQSVLGVTFSSSMKEFPNIFLPVMVDMCSLGEKTGSLSVMLGHCSRIFEQDLDLLLKRFSSLIEPVLMIFMGLVVGSIALSIILPVYEITNHLTH